MSSAEKYVERVRLRPKRVINLIGGTINCWTRILRTFWDSTPHELFSLHGQKSGGLSSVAWRAPMVRCMAPVGVGCPYSTIQYLCQAANDAFNDPSLDRL